MTHAARSRHLKRFESRAASAASFARAFVRPQLIRGSPIARCISCCAARFPPCAVRHARTRILSGGVSAGRFSVAGFAARPFVACTRHVALRVVPQGTIARMPARTAPAPHGHATRAAAARKARLPKAPADESAAARPRACAAFDARARTASTTNPPGPIEDGRRAVARVLPRPHGRARRAAQPSVGAPSGARRPAWLRW